MQRTVIEEIFIESRECVWQHQDVDIWCHAVAPELTNPKFELWNHGRQEVAMPSYPCRCPLSAIHSTLARGHSPAMMVTLLPLPLVLLCLPLLTNLDPPMIETIAKMFNLWRSKFISFAHCLLLPSNHVQPHANTYNRRVNIKRIKTRLTTETGCQLYQWFSFNFVSFVVSIANSHDPRRAPALDVCGGCRRRNRSRLWQSAPIIADQPPCCWLLQQQTAAHRRWAAICVSSAKFVWHIM